MSSTNILYFKPRFRFCDLNSESWNDVFIVLVYLDVEFEMINYDV